MIRFLTTWAARRLAKRATQTQRERILARARQLRAELGLSDDSRLA